VVNEPECICKLIQDTPVTMDEWHKQKNILTTKSDVSSLELAFATFFLNRTNRSGILKAGVIGGKHQSGEWKLDVRFNKKDLISRIQRIASYQSRIKIYNLDTAKLPKKLPEKSLIYLDPPYYIKGQGLYRNFYEHKDHVEIRTLLDEINNIPWLVSYDNADEIGSIYARYRKQVFDLQYSAQIKRVASEVMIYSDGLKIPDVHLGKKVA